MGTTVAPILANIYVAKLENELHLIIDYLISFDKEYFQQIFCIIMGTTVAPILANIYVAKLENELRKKRKSEPKLLWPILLKRFIADGFGIFYGTLNDIMYMIKTFNMLIKSIKINKWSIGSNVEYMDLEMFKGSRFFTCGKMDIKLLQKKDKQIFSFTIS